MSAPDSAEAARDAAVQAIKTGRTNCSDCGDPLIKGAFPSMLASLQAHQALVCRPERAGYGREQGE